MGGEKVVAAGGVYRATEKPLMYSTVRLRIQRDSKTVRGGLLIDGLLSLTF